MKKSLLAALIALPLAVYAAEKPKSTEVEGERKPASTEQELIGSRLKTADILARARLNNQVCELDAYQTEILREVSSVQYRSGFSPSQISGAVQQAMGGVIAFNEIVNGKDVSVRDSESDWQKVLVNSYWESIGMGVYGPQYRITLRAGGKIDIERMEVLNEEPWYRIHKETGSWKVSRRAERRNSEPVMRLMLKLSNREKVYRLEKSYENHGMWQLNQGPKTGSDARPQFFNYFSNECEA